MMASSEDAKSFEDHLVKLANGAFTTHGISLGTHLKLFDIIASLGKPSTSSEIANAGGFKERYIREWLGLMVVGDIIKYNQEEKTFFIPAYRLPYLTEQGKEKNFTQFSTGIPVCTSVFKEVESCFEENGPRGVPYSSYKGFHDFRTAHLSVAFQPYIMENTFKKIPGLCEKLEQGISVCDAGCSTGRQVHCMAERYPKSTFLGFDIDENAVTEANDKATKLGLKNITFTIQDGCNMPDDWTNKFDLVTVWDVVHDVPYAKKFIEEIKRVIRPGGMFFMSEINLHSELGDNIPVGLAPTLYGFSLFHCMPVSLYFEDGEGLGTTWGVENQQKCLEEAGFCQITQLENEGFNSNFYCIKKE